MLSNFQFLRPEFSELFEAARKAEQYARSDARASVIYARMALEASIIWLYEHDHRLQLPYDSSLGALLHGEKFRNVVPEQFFHKAKAIQKAGNFAVHNQRKPVRQWEAQSLTRELFHSLYWLARTYHRQPLATVGDFDPEIIPREGEAPASVKLDEARVNELQSELEKKAKELEEREKALDAKLAEVQEQVALARVANIQEEDTHDYSEAKTRELHIDLDLKRAGWDLSNPQDTEFEVEGMPNPSGKGFVDYVLWGENGKPLAVVEAKRTTENVDRGQQQAKLYADCLEKRFGVRPLIYYTNGYEINFWDDMDYPPREVSGYRTREELELLIQRRGKRQTPAASGVNKEIAGRPYQKRAIGSLSEHIVSKHRRGLLVMATGTGKTRTAIALVDLLQRCNWVKRALFLADRVSLVNQAANAFKKNLPSSSPVNLCTEKKSDGRVYLSTYPTMMGLIDELDKGMARFGPGFFDLIIIDEAHRSVYQRYRAIFGYFDSLLIGLTATPREEVDRNTYELFDLEDGVPNDAYELEDAVREEWLVPPRVKQVNLRYPREGIRYENLSEEEKRKWETTDWGDDMPTDAYPDGVDAGAINKWLFNEDTVDKVLEILMEQGHKVAGGDRLAKTIIFARSHDHAAYIEKRFNHHFPEYKGSFARVVDNQVKYAQSLIDDFSLKEKDPHIAISVDMLDTGIDVPEVANLVFFKPVYSKIKFWQMIGRGTRLCPSLYGDGEDKTDFRIFDFCFNFEFFEENPEGIGGGVSETLGKRLFKSRARIVHLLDESPGFEGVGGVRETLVSGLRSEIHSMNRENFLVRKTLSTVELFAEESQWNSINEEACEALQRDLSGLPTQVEKEKEETKRFDLLCYQIELALLENESGKFEMRRLRVIEIAANLETKPSVPAIKSQLAYLQSVQQPEFWECVSLEIVEELRLRLRGLAQFVDKKKKRIVYTNLEDEVLEVKEVQTVALPSMTSSQYEKKVNDYLKSHLDSIAIQKLRLNEPLTKQDLESLEETLVSIGEREGDKLLKSLLEKSECPTIPYFVRTLVGLDRKAVQKLLGAFLEDRTLSSSQIRFLQTLVEQLTQRGVVESKALYESPYADFHDEGPDGLFAGRDNLIEGVFEALRNVRKNLIV
ncbi:DEAD/DEAH box helicase family protein [Pelagicoccus albus]|uniref:DEAD/DEAH box helicase family protein n=1 Tax=Pelagicoccus albus TaxID=415222 RepID=A0A7X1B4R6_9BACT|nr:DEAD/DEAH box helicase family protein [Pelagicoccus albus]MBC2605633.1 DEAD/DEAH box helicase family protein [Pelagicoccus albus]